LPEAALHCVFCGAKQPPAPAVAPGVAKTAFGYSANEVMAELNRPRPSSQNASYPAQPPYASQPHPPSQPPPYASQPHPPSQPPPYASQPHPPSQPPPYGNNAAHAATMLASGPAPQYPMGSGGLAPQNPMVPTAGPAMPTHAIGGPAAAPGMGIHSPQQITPQPLPTAPPPYLASQTAARARHPIEPWRDALKLWMFIWGAITLAAFVTPLRSDPMTFSWDVILHADVKDKLPPLIMASVGLLSVLLAAIPMAAVARGVLAAILGLAGVFVPLLVDGMPPWQLLVPFVATVVLVPGLLVRNEYTESTLARVLVTLGVIALLVPQVIPIGGHIPLVDDFKGLMDAQGIAKLKPALELGLLVIAVISLLVWMPGPATGGAKVFAWLLILWSTLVLQIGGLVIAGAIGDAVKASPFGATMAWAPVAAYFVLIGYGLATVIGKQLE
jgi:hypothetical protein